MQHFNSWLRGAEVADLRVTSAPGGFALLPWGAALVQRFGEIVREAAVELAMDEYEFPRLAQEAVYQPSRDLIDLEFGLVRTVATASGSAPMVLSPTGEQIIYDYWSRTLAVRGSFPARIFQRGRYFRPASSHRLSGGGVYKSVEAGDVFEFHASHLQCGEAEEDARRLHGLFRKVAKRAAVAAVWGTRPPWTNNGHLYEWAVGGDALLPAGTTVQIACAYFQGQAFSEKYGVGVSENGRFHPAWQADGAISRRLAFAALHQSLGAGARGCVSPDLAPTQLVVLGCDLAGDDASAIHEIAQELNRAGIRTRVALHASKAQFRMDNQRWRNRAVPLRLVVLGPGLARFRLCRGDNELELELDQPGAIARIVGSALRELAAAADQRARSLLDQGSAPVNDVDDLPAVLRSGKIARVPMRPDRESASCIAALNRGELLGFVRTGAHRPAFCGEARTNVIGLVSRRL